MVRLLQAGTSSNTPHSSWEDAALATKRKTPQHEEVDGDFRRQLMRDHGDGNVAWAMAQTKTTGNLRFPSQVSAMPNGGGSTFYNLDKSSLAVDHSGIVVVGGAIHLKNQTSDSIKPWTKECTIPPFSQKKRDAKKAKWGS